MKSTTKFALLLIALATALLAAGCATEETNTQSPVPWGRPASWEGQMPGVQQ